MNPEDQTEEAETDQSRPVYSIMTEPLEYQRIVPTIEAIQFTGSDENVKAVELFFGGARRVKVKHTILKERTEDTGSVKHRLKLEFEMPQGRDEEVDLVDGDWIVRLVDRGRVRTFSYPDEWFQKEFTLKEADLSA